MAPVLFTICLLFSFILFRHTWWLGRNILRARSLKLPYIIVPVDQSSVVWMLGMMPLKPFLERLLSASIYRRLKLTTFDWEWEEKRRPFTDYALAPLEGSGKTFVMAGAGSMLEVWTCDADLAIEVLSRPFEFHISKIGTMLLGALGPNVLSTNGRAWSVQRRILQQVVNERIAKLAFEESRAQATAMLDEVGSGSGAVHVIEAESLFDMAKKFAINVLSATVMGISSPWDEAAGDRAPPPGFKTTFMGACAILLSSIPGGFVIPRGVLERWPRWAPGYERMRSVGAAKAEYPRHVNKLLSDEREAIRNQDPHNNHHPAAVSNKSNNILSQLFRAAEPGSGKEAADKASPLLSEECLMSNLFVVTGAGFDTSANSISLVLLMLARYPQWQDWLLDEIQGIIPPKDGHQAALDYAAIFPRAIRVQAFFLETLRLYPPLTKLLRDSAAAQTLKTSTGSLALPAGTRVHIDVVALHLDPMVWRGLNHCSDPSSPIDDSQPTRDTTNDSQDELRFRPSRWLEASGALFRPPRGAYLAWSAGGRVCPGQKMSQVELAAFVISVLQRYKVRASLQPGETEEQALSRLDATMQDCESGPTLHMRQGASVLLERRVAH